MLEIFTAIALLIGATASFVSLGMLIPEKMYEAIRLMLRALRTTIVRHRVRQERP
jgi:hypothetical protein